MRFDWIFRSLSNVLMYSSNVAYTKFGGENEMGPNKSIFDRKCFNVLLGQVVKLVKLVRLVIICISKNTFKFKI